MNLGIFNLKPTTPEDIKKILYNEGISPNTETAKLLIETIFNNEKLNSNYYPSPYYGQVSLIKAAECIQEDKIIWSDKFNGWENIIPNIKVYQTPGVHNQLFDFPYIQDLSKLIINIKNQEELI